MLYYIAAVINLIKSPEINLDNCTGRDLIHEKE